MSSVADHLRLMPDTRRPVWSALISAVVFRDFLPLPVYASLVPIIAGVSLASLKELTFSWFSFTAGTMSAVTSAAKAILSKKVLDGKPLGENLTPANMFAILSILGFVAIAPVSLIIEPPKAAAAAWAAALANGYTNAQLVRLLGVSGFLYYIYNEGELWTIRAPSRCSELVTAY